MSDLFNRTRLLQQDVARNIVKKRPSPDTFSDLTEDKQSSHIADKVIAFVMQQTSEELESDFHYTVAINYPFESDRLMSSRYSDGTFSVWYGAFDYQTAMYETAYNALKKELAIEVTKTFLEKPIIRHRVIYDVFCDGLLVDLTQKRVSHPNLMLEDYAYTQAIGKQLSSAGYPGLLTPSARMKKGVCVNIFKASLLSRPRLNHELTYHIDRRQKKVDVYAENKKLHEIVF